MTTTEKKFFVVQDTTHIATKLRNRLLKPNIVLPLGTHRINIGHLQSLVKNVQKSVHGLCMTDVCPIDRMNFSSFQKITDDRVIQSLSNNVTGSEATVKYLKVCKEVTSSYLDFELAPLERVFRIWHALFFIRIWRKSIIASKSYHLKENFISSNAYTCIEINAQNLLFMIRKFREETKPEQFLTSLFDSQMCENAFRQFRSMGTAEYTKINFSLYELLHMIGRIEVQNDIAYVKLADQHIHFPNKRKNKSKCFPLPSDNELDAIISKAKEQSILDAQEFGMTGPYDIDDFQIQSRLQIKDLDIISEDSEDDENIRNENFDYDDYQINPVDGDGASLGAGNALADGKTAFTTVLDENGIERTIRKSSLLWMLTEPSTALSKDRLRRFQTVEKKRKIN